MRDGGMEGGRDGEREKKGGTHSFRRMGCN